MTSVFTAKLTQLIHSITTQGTEAVKLHQVPSYSKNESEFTSRNLSISPSLKSFQMLNY